MRIRVLGILGLLLCLIVVILSAVLLQSVSRDATSEVQLNRLAALNRFVQLAAHAEGQSDLDMLQLEIDSYTELYGEGLLISLGQQQLVSGSIDPQDPAVAETVRNAGLNLERIEIPQLNAFSTEPALISRPFGNSAQVLGSVTMQVNLEAARDQVISSATGVLLVTLGFGAALLLIADRLTAWVLRPVHRLDDAVNDLAKTQQPVALEEQGPPELRALSRSLGAMAQAMAGSLEQQRELIAETSHQLRNPVAALRLRVDLLKLRLGEAGPQAVQAVEKELERVEILLDGVLRLASAEHRLAEQHAGDQLAPAVPRSQRIHAARMLAEELERHTEAAQRVGTKLELDAATPQAQQAVVACNGFDLQQMLAELVENALKYAPGTRLLLRVLAAADTVDIQVIDHGSGMSAAELQQAGQRFWRAEHVRSGPGTGLGIAIVDRLARANAGELLLACPAGAGLQATLRLPRAEQEPEGSDG